MRTDDSVEAWQTRMAVRAPVRSMAPSVRATVSR